MKNNYKKFMGMMPIMPTPILENGDPDIASTERIVDYLMASNPACIGHMGGASEYFKVAEDDREPILKATIERVAGRVPVFVGVTALSVKQSLKNARQAYELGADMLMVCSPVTAPMEQHELLKFYHAVAEETPLPIIIQDTGASANAYTAEFMAELCKKIPTAGYVKAEGANFLRKTVDLQNLLGDDVQVIGGAAGFHMLQLLRQNVTAFMTGTEAIELHGAVVHSFLSGEIDKAIDLYYTTVLPYLTIYNLSYNHMLKYMLKRRGIITNDEILFPYDAKPTDPLILQEFEYIMDRIEKDKIAIRK